MRARNTNKFTSMLFGGIVAIILGILILYRWPVNAVWLLGFFTGLSFLFTGVWMIMLPRAISNHLSQNLTQHRPN